MSSSLTNCAIHEEAVHCLAPGDDDLASAFRVYDTTTGKIFIHEKDGRALFASRGKYFPPVSKAFRVCEGVCFIHARAWASLAIERTMNRRQCKRHSNSDCELHQTTAGLQTNGQRIAVFIMLPAFCERRIAVFRGRNVERMGKWKMRGWGDWFRRYQG